MSRTDAARVEELILENRESQNIVISTILILLSERPSYVKLLKELGG